MEENIDCTDLNVIYFAVQVASHILELTKNLPNNLKNLVVLMKISLRHIPYYKNYKMLTGVLDFNVL